MTSAFANSTIWQQRSAIIEDEPIQTTSTKGSTNILQMSSAIGCDVVLGSVVDGFCDSSLCHSCMALNMSKIIFGPVLRMCAAIFFDFFTVNR